MNQAVVYQSTKKYLLNSSNKHSLLKELPINAKSSPVILSCMNYQIREQVNFLKVFISFIWTLILFFLTSFFIFTCFLLQLQDFFVFVGMKVVFCATALAYTKKVLYTKPSILSWNCNFYILLGQQIFALEFLKRASIH